jgi:hypothetical protein
MIGARRYVRLRWSRPQRLASVNRGYVYRATGSSIHKSFRLRWSHPQRLASVNRGYVYRAAGSIYINRSVFVSHTRNGLCL